MSQTGKTILFFIPTHSFATKERVALRDMSIALESGFKVYLATNLQSYLAESASKLGVECFQVGDHFINRLTDYHKHYPISKKIKKYQIDIIHCYDFNFLFSIATQMRSFNLTSLVFTQDHTIDKPLQKFWYKPLISRIDFLILLNKHLKNDLVGNLGLAQKKVEYFGMGIRNIAPAIPEVLEESFRPYKDYFLAGTFVSPELKSIDPLVPILLALKVINQKRENNLPVKLVLISHFDFKELSIFKELLDFIAENQIGDDILFASTADVDGVMTKLSVWISNAKDEFLEDYAVSALVHEIPILAPRNFCSLELLREYEGVGELYKLYDSRELREKWTKIILGFDLYKDKARLFKFFIEKEHDFKLYKNDLLDLYAKMTLRRNRVYKSQ